MRGLPEFRPAITYRVLVPEAFDVLARALAGLTVGAAVAASPLRLPAQQPAAVAPAETLHVVVTDQAGVPLPGAAVAIAELGRSGTADAGGAVTFPDLPPGRYTLSARRIGFVPAVRAVTVPGPRELAVRLEPTALRLEPITVTATRSTIDAMASPLPADALGGERLREEQTVSLAQTIDGMAGVRALSTGEQVGKPVIRGLTGPRVLTLDDGLRLEDYSWSDEDGPSVDPLLAERVEVIRGPASVLYGSDAIGGVVNVVPDELPDARGRPGFVRGEVELSGGTNNGEIGGPLRLEGGSGRVGWRGIFIGRRAGNYHTPPGNALTPSGELFNTGYRAFNGELALGLRGDRSNGTIRYERYGGDFGLLDGPPVPEDDSLGPLRKLADDRVQVATDWLLGRARLETRSQWQRHSLRELVGRSRVGDEEPTFELLLNTFTTDLMLHHAGPGRLGGTVGLSGLYQTNESEGEFPLVPGARTAAGALFAFEQAALGRWSLLAGARIDLRYVSADANAALDRPAESRTLAALTGDLGAVYRLAEGLAVAANLGRAYRAPTLFELYTNGPHLGEDRYEVGLPDARAELSLNADLSLRWRRGIAAGEVGVYRNQIDNYLYVQPTDSQVTVTREAGETETLPLFRFVQTARAVLWGVDLSGEVAPLRPLTLRGRLDFVRGTNRATGEPLPLMPPLRGDLEAELHTVGSGPLGRARVTARLQLVARQTRLGPFDTPTDGYALLDLSAGLERELGGRRVSFGVRVLNATNARYTDFLSRYKSFAFGQGRNVVVRVGVGL